MVEPRRAEVLAAVMRLAGEQDGVVSRAQLVRLGMSADTARAQVGAGRWQRLWPGIFATFTGPLPPRSEVWAAALHAGRGAVLAGNTALWLSGVVDQLHRPIRVCVPHGRKVVPVPGVAMSARRHLVRDTTPAALPRRMPVDQALLDEVDRAGSADVVVGLVLQLLQRRASTPARVRAELARWPRLRHRRLVIDLLAEADGGVQSSLEHRYAVDVERAHGLPRGIRNRAEVRTGTTAGSSRSASAVSGARRRYRDVRYTDLGLLVELDGEAAHPTVLAWRDRLRDNDSMLDGDRTLRYGWREVVATPCAVADQVAAALSSGGWTGQVRGCGPLCHSVSARTASSA